MMKRGIRVESDFENGLDIFTVYKTKGRLTLEEIQDALSESGMEGYAVIMLRVGQDLDDGWTDRTEAVGDSCTCFEIMEGSDCPVCRKIAPLRMWCPECGTRLKPFKEVKE